MTTDQLTEGMLLQLEQDVQNPSPDRRSKDWNKLPVWTAGTQFIVREQNLRANDYLPAEQFMVLEPCVRYGIIYSLRSPSDGFDRVLAACEPVAATLGSVIQANHAEDWGYKHVLQVLLKEGKVTLDDVRRALATEPIYEVAR